MRTSLILFYRIESKCVLVVREIFKYVTKLFQQIVLQIPVPISPYKKNVSHNLKIKIKINCNYFITGILIGTYEL